MGFARLFAKNPGILHEKIPRVVRVINISVLVSILLELSLHATRTYGGLMLGLNGWLAVNETENCPQFITRFPPLTLKVLSLLSSPPFFFLSSSKKRLALAAAI
jgi:hypothetical protein